MCLAISAAVATVVAVAVIDVPAAISIPLATAFSGALLLLMSLIKASPHALFV
jgi:hypothetical protein